MADVASLLPSDSSTKIYVFSLSGASRALRRGDPAAAVLKSTTITVASYASPPNAPQRATPLTSLPLGNCINLGNATCPYARRGPVAVNQGLLDSGPGTVMYSPAWNGRTLWAVMPAVDPTTQAAVIRYYVIDSRRLTLTKEGTIAAPNGNSLIMPAVAINGKGKTGVVVFTLTGPDFWPSAAFAVIQGGAVKSTVYVAALGPGPNDGGTSYSLLAPTWVSRWGDYSAARVDERGNFWFATEYIAQVGRGGVVLEGRGQGSRTQAGAGRALLGRGRAAPRSGPMACLQSPPELRGRQRTDPPLRPRSPFAPAADLHLLYVDRHPGGVPRRQGHRHAHCALQLVRMPEWDEGGGQGEQELARPSAGLTAAALSLRARATRVMNFPEAVLAVPFGP
jgi:hypothetical protein